MIKKEIQDKIIIDYKINKFSQAKISRDYKISYSTIKSILNKNSIQIEDRKSKYRINQDFFKNIDSHEKAYFLGFLWADGCNYKTDRGYYLHITLQERDSYILNYFGSLIYKDNNPNIGTRKRTGVQQNEKILRICNKTVVEDLFKLGMDNKKTIESHLPKINEEFMNSFMLGYFDGDGCIYYQYHNKNKTSPYAIIDIVSNYFIMNEMIEWFKSKNIIFRIKSTDIDKHYIHIYSLSYQNIKNIYNLLYKDQKVFLKRKHDKFLYYFEQYDKNHE